MICTATCGSGARIVLIPVIIRTRLRTTRRGLPTQEPQTVCYVAVHGPFRGTIVRSLVPFVLRGDEIGGVCISCDRQQRRVGCPTAQGVGPRLGRAGGLGAAGRLTVLQPVAEAGRIAPGDVERRTVGRLWVRARHRVAVAARTAALANALGWRSPCPCRCCRGRRCRSWLRR